MPLAVQSSIWTVSILLSRSPTIHVIAPYSSASHPEMPRLFDGVENAEPQRPYTATEVSLTVVMDLCKPPLIAAAKSLWRHLNGPRSTGIP